MDYELQVVLGLQVVTFLLLTLMVMGVFKTSGFAGTVQSVPQAINLGASHMSRRSDGVYAYTKPMSFLGAPMGGEPPVFYDIGDLSATKNLVTTDMYRPDEVGENSGFADLDQLLVNSSR
jgi:hypothetical protein